MIKGTVNKLFFKLPSFQFLEFISFLSLLLIIFSCCSCAGTIKTTKRYTANNYALKTAYIVYAKNVKYIRRENGILIRGFYLDLPKDSMVKVPQYGNTAIVIKEQLAARGITATISKENDTPEEYDFIVLYNESWFWDFKMVLLHLEIAVRSADNTRNIAHSFYKTDNTEIHNYPNSEKIVPKMMKEMFK